VQGDEPLVLAHDLETLVRLMRRPEVRIGTLVTPARAADLTSPNNCFVQRLPDGLCMSFSRNPECCSIQAWRHVGMYGFRAEVLSQLVALQPTPGEVRERLEQLRWHESGFPIYSAEVAAAGIGVDSPEDLDYVRGIFSGQVQPKA
jgi:3-deoxy-manno-octulosonate cytidylyltransferase (CMP-KDO synthetase)